MRFLAGALDHAESAQFLRVDAKGFVLLCRIPRKELVPFRRSLRLGTPNRIQSKVVNTERTGVHVLLVKILLPHQGARRHADRLPNKRFLGLMDKFIFHDMSRLRVDGGLLVTSFVGEDSAIEKLIEELRRFSSAIKIVRLGRPRALGTNALDALTVRQRSIIQLAHAMGYYNVPRKASTEDIARILGMNKGTIGDHLRRGERHLMDSLLLLRSAPSSIEETKVRPRNSRELSNRMEQR